MSNRFKVGDVVRITGGFDKGNVGTITEDIPEDPSGKTAKLYMVENYNMEKTVMYPESFLEDCNVPIEEAVNTPYEEPEPVAKFEAGNKVNIVSGRMEGSTGTIKEAVKTYHDGERIYEYRVVLDGERNERVYFEYNLESEDILDQYVDPDSSVITEQEELQLKLECIKNNLNENGIVLAEGEDLLDYSYYYEMAGRIPGELKVGKKGILIVAMGANEDRGEAHFHIFRSKNDWKAWKNGACLLFKENKYFDHADNRETLTRGEMETLVQCLKSKPKQNFPGDTYWQYLIYLWNGNNSDFEIDINTPMPDYSYDTITRYKSKN